jgi:hypothetical protein
VSFRRKLLFAAGAEVLIIILVFVVYSLGEDLAPLRARRTLTLLMMLQAMLAAFAPLFAAEAVAGAGKSWRAGLSAATGALGWLMAVCFSGPLLLVLFFDRGGFTLWLAALLIIFGAGLASAGLVLALGRLSRKPMLTVCLSAVLLLAFELQPLYTLKLIRGSRSAPAAQRLLLATGVRTSWMGVAHAMKGPPWQYDISSPTLYPPNWTGSDYLLNRPGPLRHFLEYLAIAAILAGLGVLRRNKPEAPKETEGPTDESTDFTNSTDE